MVLLRKLFNSPRGPVGGVNHSRPSLITSREGCARVGRWLLRSALVKAPLSLCNKRGEKLGTYSILLNQG